MQAASGFDEAIRSSLELLKSRNVVFEDGLSDSEIEHCERRFDIRFPPDLSAFLQAMLPVGIQSEWGGDAFPNWRSPDEARLRERLNWPFDGIAFDIENSEFWLAEWGPKPDSIQEAVRIARRHVEAAPKLIPVCSHRYLPSEPLLAGNPVFSVYQTDIIYYGCDLWDYFWNEFAPQDERWKRFKGTSEAEFAAAFRPIRFWTEMTALP